MSLTELSTEVRASRLLSPDDLLDKIGAKMQATPNQLPIRGRLRTSSYPLNGVSFVFTRASRMIWLALTLLWCLAAYQLVTPPFKSYLHTAHILSYIKQNITTHFNLYCLQTTILVCMQLFYLNLSVILLLFLRQTWPIYHKTSQTKVVIQRSIK